MNKRKEINNVSSIQSVKRAEYSLNKGAIPTIHGYYCMHLTV